MQIPLNLADFAGDKNVAFQISQMLAFLGTQFIIILTIKIF